MKRNDFNDLMAYLRARPSEVQRLRDVLKIEAEEKEQSTTWVGTMKAAKMLGVSDDWLRKHKLAFPETLQTIERGRSVLRFRAETLQEDYTAYLRRANKTTEVFEV